MTDDKCGKCPGEISNLDRSILKNESFSAECLNFFRYVKHMFCLALKRSMYLNYFDVTEKSWIYTKFSVQ